MSRRFLFLRSENKLKIEIVRYIIGGSITALLCYTTLIILVEIGHIHYLISGNIAGFSSYVYSYLINSFFVFKAPKRSHAKLSFGFICVQVSLFLIANLLFYAGVDVFHVSYLLMSIIVSAVSAVLNFTFLKLSVFH
jgi:putative flippase GtrA